MTGELCLNKVTIKDKLLCHILIWFLPPLHIRANYFTKLDLSQGFHQLLLSPEDREKSAITTRYGNFKWAKLYANNPEKCTWCATSVFYLGHEISAEGIRVSKEKINSITSWPTPTNVKELRSFLGLASYYRKFVKNFAFIAEPLLTKLLAKDQKWVWSKESQHSAFREL